MVAQIQIEKTILEPSITLVQIDVKNCFELILETADVPEIKVNAIIEGEYSKDLEITIHEEGSTLMIGTGFRSDFINPNDKLSAHKVVSIALHIILPIEKNAAIFGTNSRVLVTGDYTDLNIVLADGVCELQKVSSVVQVKTQSGDILVSTKSGEVKAYSKYGTVISDRIPKGNNQFTLSTITGNIEISKLK